jgi:hypothetical protein
MIKVKNIFSNSAAAFVGTIDNIKDASRQLEYIKYNKTWLDDFGLIVLSLNGNKSLIDSNLEEISNLLNPEIELLYSDNLGVCFGAMDNDLKIIDYISNKPIEYLFKFSHDIIADNSLLDLELDESYDFFYINNIGYAAFNDRTKEQLLNDIKSQTYFYPQTNYYIIKNKLSRWFPNKNELIQYYSYYQDAIKINPESRPWEVLGGATVGLEDGQGCDCEHMLAKTVRANNLKSYHLLSDADTNKIIDLIYDHKIHDGSHKNITYTNVGNLCHYHVINHPVAAI